MSDGLRITLNGMEDAEKQMQRIERGTKAMGRYTGEVGSKLPYAYGIEYGRHRKSGKLARRVGGALYITQAVNMVLSNADADLAEGLNKVTAPGPWVIRRLALWARRLARIYAPKGPKNKGRSYRLSRSIKYRVTKE
jgi:hypothetical protein